VIYALAEHKGYRDDAERFLVDFERKAWETARQPHREEKMGALEVVMAPGSSRGGEAASCEADEQREVLRELGEARSSVKDSAESLKAKRLAAAKKRMQQQQQLHQRQQQQKLKPKT
jgi:hypothetical protein